MSLILVKLSLEIVVDADTLGKDTAELAKGFAEGEWLHADVDSMEWVTSLTRLLPSWRDALPYRHPNVGPELTCRQILEAQADLRRTHGKGGVAELPAVKDKEPS